MNIECLVCGAELELPLYVSGVVYRARVGCPSCKTILYVNVDNRGNIIEYRQSGDSEVPNRQTPEEWWQDWGDSSQG